MSGLLWRIKHYLTFDTRKLFYYSYILPVFDYCLLIWGQCNKTLLDRLYRLQKRVARMVLDDYEINENDLFKCLKWLTIYNLRNSHINLHLLKPRTNMMKRSFSYKLKVHNFGIPYQ